MSILSESPNLQRAASLVRFRKPLEDGFFDLPRVSGRLVEISEPGFQGLLSVLVPLLREVQQTGQLISWVKTGKTIFFPPDFASRGLDLDAIIIVVPPGLNAGLQATEWLLKSMAFGLVVVDGVGQSVEEAILGRLSRLAEESSTAVVFTTRKQPSDPSLGALISLRVCVSNPSEGAVDMRILRDKRSGVLSVQRSPYRGPLGLY